MFIETIIDQNAISFVGDIEMPQETAAVFATAITVGVNCNLTGNCG